MITIDMDTISGVPFTGELNARPKTSAQTRKHSRNASTAAMTSSALRDPVVQPARSWPREASANGKRTVYLTW